MKCYVQLAELRFKNSRRANSQIHQSIRLMEKAHRLLILTLALVCLSCSPVYLDPAAEEIVPQELSEGGELPQTG